MNKTIAAMALAPALAFANCYTVYEDGAPIYKDSDPPFALDGAEREASRSRGEAMVVTPGECGPDMVDATPGGRPNAYAPDRQDAIRKNMASQEAYAPYAAEVRRQQMELELQRRQLELQAQQMEHSLRRREMQTQQDLIDRARGVGNGETFGMPPTAIQMQARKSAERSLRAINGVPEPSKGVCSNNYVFGRGWANGTSVCK